MPHSTEWYVIRPWKINMLELLIASGGSSLAPIKWSGPGPQSIMLGNNTYGYFGEVSSTALFTASEMVEKLLTGVVVAGIPATITWLKFVMNGKILFIPKTKLCTGVTWTTLYERGLVYGTDDNGLYPTATPTNQLQQVYKGTDAFKVRLLTGRNTDPSPNTGSGTWQDVTLSSEYVKTLGAVSNYSGRPASVPTWTKFTNTEMGYDGTYEVVMESNSNTPTVNSFSFTAPSATSGQSKTTTAGWRPVLELIPNDESMVGINFTRATKLGVPSVYIERPANDPELFGSVEFSSARSTAPITYMTKDS